MAAVEPTTCDVPRATCHVRRATCDVPRATCDVRRATCHVRRATCDVARSSVEPDRPRAQAVSAAESVVAGEHDGLRTRPDTELVEDVRGVIADGLFADVQPLGDVRVAQALG